MFTKEALEHLEKNLSANNIAHVDGMAVLPNDHSLVSTEKFQEFRNRYRGELKTDSFNGFVAYLNDFKVASDKDQTQLFVDKKTMSAKAFLTWERTINQGTATTRHCLTYSHVPSLRQQRK